MSKWAVSGEGRLVNIKKSTENEENHTATG